MVSLWVTRPSLDTGFKSLVTVVVLLMTVGTVTVVPVGRCSRLITWMEAIACKDWLVGAPTPGMSRHATDAASIPLETLHQGQGGTLDFRV